MALGTVSELKRVFAGNAVLEVTASRVGEALEAIGAQPWALETSVFGTRIHVVVRDAVEGREAIERTLAAASNPAARVAVIPDGPYLLLRG